MSTLDVSLMFDRKIVLFLPHIFLWKGHINNLYVGSEMALEQFHEEFEV